jgi:hypothetical protein
MKMVDILRWTARLWGIASALLLVAFAFGGGENLHFTVKTAIAFLFFPVGVVAGFMVAWWSDLAGGLITVGSLAVFYVYIFAIGGHLPTSPYFLLFAAPGFLHIAAALFRRGGARPSHDELSPEKQARPPFIP